VSALGRVLPLALVLSCSGARTTLIATGQTLHVAADTFVETSALMDRALDQGSVTAAQYRVWAEFGRRYQVAYPLAVQAWEVARQTEASAEVDAAQVVIARLVSQLAEFYVSASLAVANARDGGVL
jgi:hypothetical protein